MSELHLFVRESNRIEGILRAPTPGEIAAHEALLDLDRLSVHDLQQFVSAVQPGAVLRTRAGCNVRVGNYVAPPGGPRIVTKLAQLLVRINCRTINSYDAHVLYENLHPFTDGNGRSGRAVWLWMQKERRAPIGFLHAFYYQTLQASH